MDTPRIRMGHEKGEVAPNTFSDFDWVRRNEIELREKYGECLAVVYEKNVIGTGQTYVEAVENAESNLSPESGMITPVLVSLYRRQPFYRVRPHITRDNS